MEIKIEIILSGDKATLKIDGKEFKAGRSGKAITFSMPAGDDELALGGGFVEKIFEIMPELMDGAKDLEEMGYGIWEIIDSDELNIIVASLGL